MMLLCAQRLLIVPDQADCYTEPEDFFPPYMDLDLDQFCDQVESQLSHSSAPGSMLPAGGVGPSTGLVESHILFTPLLETIGGAQSAGLPLPPTGHPGAHMLHQLASRFSNQTPLGVNPELDEYLESLIQLQHAQRIEMERIMHLADDYKLTYEAHVRAMQPLFPSPQSSPSVVDSPPSAKAAARASASQATNATPATAPASLLASGMPPPEPILPSIATMTAGVRKRGQGQSLDGADEDDAADDPEHGVLEDFISNAVSTAKKRRANLPRSATLLLRKWIIEHKDYPYPSEDEKRVLCEHTGLNLVQINNWFINNRRRLLPPNHAPSAHKHNKNRPIASSEPKQQAETAANVATAQHDIISIFRTDSGTMEGTRKSTRERNGKE